MGTVRGTKISALLQLCEHFADRVRLEQLHFLLYALLDRIVGLLEAAAALFDGLRSQFGLYFADGHHDFLGVIEQ